jgi:hypothetical protein
MNTRELLSVLKCSPYFTNHETNVFAANTIGTVNDTKPFAYIVNTKPDNHPGEHWVAVHGDRKGSCSYFDSFGLIPKNATMRKFLSNKNGLYNDVLFQSKYSNLCGAYCLLYLMLKCARKDIKVMRNLFAKNTLINDHIMLHVYKTYFKKYVKKKCKNNLRNQFCVCKSKFT